VSKNGEMVPKIRFLGSFRGFRAPTLRSEKRVCLCVCWYSRERERGERLQVIVVMSEREREREREVFLRQRFVHCVFVCLNREMRVVEM
jgi:hypothetical protein